MSEKTTAPDVPETGGVISASSVIARPPVAAASGLPMGGGAAVMARQAARGLVRTSPALPGARPAQAIGVVGRVAATVLPRAEEGRLPAHQSSNPSSIAARVELHSEAVAQPASVSSDSAAISEQGSGSPRADSIAPRSYSGPIGFERWLPIEHSGSVRAAKRDIAAVKVVTRVAASLALDPAVQASAKADASRMAVLRQRLQMVVEVGAEMARALGGPYAEQDSYLQGLCCDQASELLVSCWEDGHTQEQRVRDLALQSVALIGRVRAEGSDEMRASVDQIIDAAKYRSADEGADVAYARAMISYTSAIWQLRQKVCSVKDSSGRMLTFGAQPDDIVRRLARDLFSTSKAMMIQLPSVDLQIAHLQGSLRRLSDLLAAEYVGRARRWLNDESAAPEGQPLDQVLEKLIEQCVRAANKKFVGVEQMAVDLFAQAVEAAAQERQNERKESAAQEVQQPASQKTVHQSAVAGKEGDSVVAASDPVMGAASASSPGSLVPQKPRPAAMPVRPAAPGRPAGGVQGGMSKIGPSGRTPSAGAAAVAMQPKSVVLSGRSPVQHRSGPTPGASVLPRPVRAQVLPVPSVSKGGKQDSSPDPVDARSEDQAGRDDRIHVRHRGGDAMG